MAGVVIPDPRGGHVWIYGVDSGGNPVKVLVDVSGHPQIDILSSVLPTGAATEATLATLATEAKLEAVRVLLASLDGKDYATQTTLASLLAAVATAAKQDTMITALQLIDDLRNALGSVDTDDLQVDVKTMPTTTVEAGGSDKIFSFEGTKAVLWANTSLPAGTVNVDSGVVPTGKVWLLTNVAMEYTGTVPTEILMGAYVGGTVYEWFNELAPASGKWYDRQGLWFLAAGDKIRARVFGATLNDALRCRATGVVMDAP